jgi:hypothetical protein
VLGASHFTTVHGCLWHVAHQDAIMLVHAHHEQGPCPSCAANVLSLPPYNMKSWVQMQHMCLVSATRQRSDHKGRAAWGCTCKSRTCA